MNLRPAPGTASRPSTGLVSGEDGALNAVARIVFAHILPLVSPAPVSDSCDDDCIDISIDSVDEVDEVFVRSSVAVDGVESPVGALFSPEDVLFSGGVASVWSAGAESSVTGGCAVFVESVSAGGGVAAASPDPSGDVDGSPGSAWSVAWPASFVESFAPPELSTCIPDGG